MFNRAGLDALVHPLTKDAVEDHSDFAIWLGRPVELKLHTLPEVASASCRVGWSHRLRSADAKSRENGGVMPRVTSSSSPNGKRTVHRGLCLCAVSGLAMLAETPLEAAEQPKRGGTLTFMIPADAPPSFDGHRENSFATVHAAAPFYSVLIRVNPENPSSTTDFVCDLCTEMPTPTDGGRTYTFKIRDGVKFHDGSPLTAADVAASWQEIIHPSEGVSSARESYFIMVDKVEAPDATTVVFRLKFATNAFLPSLADPFAWIYKKEILVKDPHWFEKNIMGSGPFKFAGYEIGQSIKGERNPDYYHKGQ